MTRRGASCVALMLAVLATAAPSWAQVVAITRPATSQSSPPLVEVSISPAAPGTPALKYALLPKVEDQEPGNAALLYLAAATRLTAEQQAKSEEIHNLLELPLDQLTEQQVAPTRVGLDQVMAAGRRTHADWGTSIRTEGFRAQLPALGSLRRLALSLALEVRLDVKAKRYDKAIEKLQAGYAMARHIAAGSTLIEGLVGVAIASTMDQRLLELIQQPDAPNLYWPLTQLGEPFIDLRHALAFERAMATFSMPEIREIRAGRYTPRQWESLLAHIAEAWGAMGGTPPPWADPDKQQWVAVAAGIWQYPRARDYYRTQGKSDAQIAAMPVAQVLMGYWVESLDRWNDELHKWSGVPYPQAHEGYRQTEAKLWSSPDAQANPLVAGFLPSLGRARLLAVRLDRQIAMLRIVEGLRAYAATHGQLPTTLDQIKDLPMPLDPVHGRAFEYKLTGDTAVLASPPPVGDPPSGAAEYRIKLRK